MAFLVPWGPGVRRHELRRGVSATDVRGEDALYARRDILERQVRAATPGTHRYRRLARELHEAAALINRTLNRSQR
jgi:hypothetical protein